MGLARLMLCNDMLYGGSFAHLDRHEGCGGWGVSMEASIIRGLEEIGDGTSLRSRPEYLSADSYQCWIEMLT
jgi:hypothetical protein